MTEPMTMPELDHGPDENLVLTWDEHNAHTDGNPDPDPQEEHADNRRTVTVDLGADETLIVFWPGNSVDVGTIEDLLATLDSAQYDDRAPQTPEAVYIRAGKNPAKVLLLKTSETWDTTPGFRITLTETVGTATIATGWYPAHQ